MNISSFLLQFLYFIKEKNISNQINEVCLYFIRIRENALYLDYIFLLISSFLIYYLLFFRFRLYLMFKNAKIEKNIKFFNDKNRKAFITLKWLYMLSSSSLKKCKSKYQLYSNFIFLYNFIIISGYIVETLLAILSIFVYSLRNYFIDIMFIHIYLNIFPMSIYLFIHSLIIRVNKRI